MNHRDFSKFVEKGIGYIRTPEGMEINFEPNGLSPKLTVIDEMHEYFSPKDKEKLKERIERGSSEKPASAILDELSRLMDDRYNELCKKERKNFMNYVKYGTTNPIKVPHEIEKVIFNEPATIVFWKDGTKTVVKVQEGESFDPEKGLAMAFFKKMHGNTGRFNNIIHTWVRDYKPDAEKKEPHNELTFGYSEYSMEIDFPKDLDSKELDYMKNSIVSTSKFMVEAAYAKRAILKSSDAE